MNALEAQQTCWVDTADSKMFATEIRNLYSLLESPNEIGLRSLSSSISAWGTAPEEAETQSPQR
jgi:hypothetical protein